MKGHAFWCLLDVMVLHKTMSVVVSRIFFFLKKNCWLRSLNVYHFVICKRLADTVSSNDISQAFDTAFEILLHMLQLHSFLLFKLVLELLLYFFLKFYMIV